jgi:hypothetical protein
MKSEMKTRSSFEIFIPLGVFMGACALSLPTRIIAIAWMAIGVCSLGYRKLEDFPANGVHRKWLRGRRRACLHFYHLAWWPWYFRSELHEAAIRARHLFSPYRVLHRGAATPTQKEDSTKD